MSYTLAPIAVPIPGDTTGLIPGQQLSVSIPGELTTVAWVKIANESPCGLQARNVTSGTEWIAPYSIDVYPVDGLNSSLGLSPYNILGVAASSTPVAFLIVTWYSAGERPAGTYPVSLQRLTNVGNALTTSTSAANAFEQDFLTAFVLTGLATSIHAGLTFQLDVTAGIAFLTQADSSLGRVAPLATHFTTAVPSTIYFLDLNPDGSWSWGTTHSLVSNFLPIAQVTTGSTGSITGITDTRLLSSTMLAAMLGTLNLPAITTPTISTPGVYLWNQGSIGGTNNIPVLDISPSGATVNKRWQLQFGGSDGTLQFGEITDSRDVLHLYPSGQVALWTSGFLAIAGQTTVGSFGAPVIVAQTLRVHVTATTLQTILSFTVPSSGVYRVSGDAMMQDSAARALQFGVSWTNPDTSGANAQWLQSVAGSTIQVFNATNLWASGVDYAALPLTLAAKGGTTLTVIYQHGAGTPNDFVTAIVERLA